MKGGVTEATNLIVDLRENHNLFCSIVVYPVIPRGEIILRVIPTAAHTLEDVNYTIEAFKSVRDKLESGFYRDKPIPERFRSRNFNLRAMRSPARILFVLFTLLLTVQGEPVLGARTKVIVPSCRRADPCPKRLTASASPSGCRATGVAVWRLRCTASDGANGWQRCRRTNWRHEAFRGWTTSCGQWRGRDLRLFLELCPSAAEPLSEEERAERELILRRGRRCERAGAFAAADASCGCCALAETALRTAYGAGFRQGDVWLIADDAEVFARYGGRSSKVPLCGLSPEGTGRGGVRGLFLHRMRVGSKSDVKTVAQRRPADRGLGMSIRPGMPPRCGPMASISSWTDDPESIGRSMTFCPTAPPFRPSFCRVRSLCCLRIGTGNAGRKGLFGTVAGCTVSTGE